MVLETKKECAGLTLYIGSIVAEFRSGQMETKGTPQFEVKPQKIIGA